MADWRLYACGAFCITPQSVHPGFVHSAFVCTHTLVHCAIGNAAAACQHQHAVHQGFVLAYDIAIALLSVLPTVSIE